MRPRRILHCIPSMGGGGAERQLAYVSKELVRLGWEVHVALGAGGPNLARLEAGGATVHRLRQRGSHNPLLLGDLLRTIERVEPALVQVWMLQMEILGGLAARRARLPLIFSERCSELAYPPSVKHWLRQRTAARASAVVSNSQEGRKYWESRLDARVPQYVVPNALPIEEIDSVPAANPAAAGVPASEDLVLFAGRLTEQKNPATFVAAVAALLKRHRVAAIVAGEGPLRDNLRRLARERGIEDRVIFCGYRQDLWSWMKRAAMFVSPSLFEGHPNTVMEAAACRCALVVSDIPAHRAFLDQSSSLLVPANSAEAIAEAMAQILVEPEAARRRANRAREIASLWSVERIAQQYDRVYTEVLNRNGL